MAAFAPPDQAAGLLQKLSLDPQAKTLEISQPTNKPSVDSGNLTDGHIKSRDGSSTPTLPGLIDHSMCYLPNGYPSTAYYYGGYDGTDSEWKDYTPYVNSEGLEVTPGVYGDNGSQVYHHGYGYAPYGPYSPAATPVPNVGHDGQPYGALHYQYQYPTPYFQSAISGPYHTPAPSAKGDISASAAADQAPLSVAAADAKSNGIANSGSIKKNTGLNAAKPTYPISSYGFNGTYGRGGLPGGIPASGYQDPIFLYDGSLSPISWLDGSFMSDGQPRPLTGSLMTSSISNGNDLPSSRNQNFHPHLMGLHHARQMSGMNSTNGYINRTYPNKLYGQYGNTYRSGFGCGSNIYDSRTNGYGYMAVDSKYKSRGRGNGFYGYGSENGDGLNELNKGPRAKSSKNQKGVMQLAPAFQVQNALLNGTAYSEEKSSAAPDREQYNQPDFPETYSEAKFFVIKSYSEDDVHKSIKYNVWASTPNGNKKLDAVYQDSQQKSGGCPVFLFFSVNTSGQFVGVAEMVGHVDFSKNVGYWQQDKWIGCFPVKWHIVKDVSNSLLKHIILGNNENKPVTNSRDTQEVKLEQGLQMLKIFKDHSSKQCVLDDFEFYEDRQKRIQEKKAKQQQSQKQTQVWEGKPAEKVIKENTNGNIKSETLEVISDVVKETTPFETSGDDSLSDNSSLAKPNAPETLHPDAVLQNSLANGVVNSC